MENKETFDIIAQEYDKHRPTYPSKLFEDIINYSMINRDARILEIGCGTGQATNVLIHKGYENITCIELGESLSKLASEKFSKYKKVNVIHSSFEDWDAYASTYDLAISATAFHFIDPIFGYQKVHNLLRKNGSIGFFWTVHVQRYDELNTEKTHIQSINSLLNLLESRYLIV